jgi:hypothetical protein
MSTPDPLPRPAHRPAPPRVGAQEFRTTRAEHRRDRTDSMVAAVAVVVLVVAAYAVLTARPVAPGTGPPDANSDAPAIVVRLGTPLAAVVNCTGGGNVTTERVPWINESQPITTGDADPRITELFDGDFVSDPHAAANVNATSVCTGSVPDPTSRWYAALESPNGTNVLSYTVAGGWQTVGGGAWNVLIPDGSNLTIVENPSLVQIGYSLNIIGFANGAAITGAVTL